MEGYPGSRDLRIPCGLVLKDAMFISINKYHLLKVRQRSSHATVSHMSVHTQFIVIDSGVGAHLVHEVGHARFDHVEGDLLTLAAH